MIYSPFQQLCNRDLVLPKNIRHKFPSIVGLGPDEAFDNDIFGAAWVSCKVIREKMYRQEGENIKELRKNSNVAVTTVTSLQQVLANNKRNNRKQCKLCP